MIDERTINLINADIDGELEPAQRPELDAILESSAEARTMRTELLKLANLLDSTPAQQPPAGLTEQIISGVSLPAKRPSFSLAGLFSSFQPATAGLAFAAGLLLTVGFYEMSPGRQPSADAASMVGTMVAGSPRSADVARQDMYLQGVGFAGTISLTENAGVYVLNFDLDSEAMTEVVVGLDQTGLSFGGFAEIESNVDDALESVKMSGGTMRVVNQGRQQFAVFLRENGTGQVVDARSMTIGFSSEGGLVDDGAAKLN